MRTTKLLLLVLMGVVMVGCSAQKAERIDHTSYDNFQSKYYNKHGWDKKDCNCLGEWVPTTIPFGKDVFDFLIEKDVYTYIFGPDGKGSIWVCDQPEVWLKGFEFQQEQKERDARHEATNNLY